jgi:hypothetical protein
MQESAKTLTGLVTVNNANKIYWEVDFSLIDFRLIDFRLRMVWSVMWIRTHPTGCRGSGTRGTPGGW